MKNILACTFSIGFAALVGFSALAAEDSQLWGQFRFLARPVEYRLERASITPATYLLVRIEKGQRQVLPLSQDQYISLTGRLRFQLNLEGRVQHARGEVRTKCSQQVAQASFSAGLLSLRLCGENQRQRVLADRLERELESYLKSGQAVAQIQ